MSELVKQLRDEAELYYADMHSEDLGLVITEAADVLLKFETDTRLDTAMKLLRDNKSSMHFDREMSQADHDVLREARKWR